MRPICLAYVAARIANALSNGNGSRPAQRLQAAALGGARDALEERLAVGLAAKALERVGGRAGRSDRTGIHSAATGSVCMTRSAARYASGLRRSK